ncbi:MAG: hypothetical protein WBA73_15550 [Devosia sp.]
MKKPVILVLTAMLMASPAIAQDWGSDYNMGSIGVSGGDAASGTIVIDCAEAGNGVVPQGSLSVFVNPAPGAAATAGDFSFHIGGNAITLPFADNGGDGFVHDKTADSLDQLSALFDALETGDEVVVRQADSEIADIGLAGAGAALDGVEACLVP